MKYGIVTIFLLFATFLFGQNITDCSTPTPDYQKAMERMTRLKQVQVQNNSRAAPDLLVRVMIHRISDNTGIAGPSDQEIDNQLDILRADFASADICFALVGINYIRHDSLFSVVTWGAHVANTLNPMFGSEDRIDIYVFPTEYGDITGAASGIPGFYFVCTEGRWFGSKNFTHEMGHCLGLLHTHETWGDSCLMTSPRIELINASNCTTAGDLLCSTSADPNLDTGGLSISTCTFSGTQSDCSGNSPYSPPFANFMSYGWSCRNNFTQEQIDIMRAELMTGGVGMKVSTNANFYSFFFNYIVNSGVSHFTVWNYIDSNFSNRVIGGSAKVYETAGSHIILREGFEAKPTSGRYVGRVENFCN